MSHLHQELAASRWNLLTLVEQLGNIGSEVERTLRRYFLPFARASRLGR